MRKYQVLAVSPHTMVPFTLYRKNPIRVFESCFFDMGCVYIDTFTAYTDTFTTTQTSSRRSSRR
jgi:hypothetical protein